MQAGAISYLQKTATAEQVIVTVRDAVAGTARLNPTLLSRLTQAIHRSPAPDLVDPDASAVDRLVSLGARVVAEHELGDGSHRWTVMQDPEGNEFCLAQKSFAG